MSYNYDSKESPVSLVHFTVKCSLRLQFYDLLNLREASDYMFSNAAENLMEQQMCHVSHELGVTLSQDGDTETG